MKEVLCTIVGIGLGAIMFYLFLVWTFYRRTW